MVTILKAGVVILRAGETEPDILLVFRGKHNDWTFPKGHCEPGETFEETAVREAKEETGLSVELIRALSTMEYIDSQQNLCTLHMYLATPLKPDQKLKTEYSKDELQWTPLSDVEDKLSYQNLKEYFRSIKEVICTTKIRENTQGDAL